MNTINLSILGLRLLSHTSPMLGQAANWEDSFGSILSLLNMIGLVLCFGGLLFAATMFMMGQTERVLYGVVGAAIGGLAWVITRTMFEEGGGGAGGITIDMGAGGGGE